MKRERLIQHLLIAFGAALVVYGVAFGVIEFLRTRKGGWQVTFQTDAAGVPEVRVSQPWLRITNVSFQFPEGQTALTNLQRTIVFDQPITNVPFGQVVYLDTTFLPGAIVFDLFGHEVQLLPRVLLVDRQETPWQSGRTVVLP